MSERFVQNRRYAIAERSGTGHRWMYVGVLQRYLASMQSESLIFSTRRAITEPEAGEHLPSTEAVHFVPEPIARFYFSTLWKSYRAGASVIVIPDADHYLPYVLLTPRFLRKRLSLLLLRPPGPSASTLKQRTKQRNIGLLRRLGTQIFTLVSDETAAATSPNTVPEPVQLSAISDSSIEALLDPATYWFGVFGYITPRKNPDLILSALSKVDSPNVGLVLAGIQADDVRGQVDRLRKLAVDAGKQVVVLERFLTDSELDTAIRSVDCVVVAHANEATSGILMKAILAGKAVIGAGAEALRSTIVDGRHGYFVPCDVESLTGAMNEIVDFCPPGPQSNSAGTEMFAGRLTRSEILRTDS